MTATNFLSPWAAGLFYLAVATNSKPLLTATWALAWITSTTGIAFNAIAFQKLQKKYNTDTLTLVSIDALYHWIPLWILTHKEFHINKRKSTLTAIAIILLYTATVSPCTQYFACP